MIDDVTVLRERLRTTSAERNKYHRAGLRFLLAEGHDLCHENRRQLWQDLGMDGEPPTPVLVPRAEFEAGCVRYQNEIYGPAGPAATLAPREPGWLVGRRVKGAGGIGTWLSHFKHADYHDRWTESVKAARRFAQREQAERAIYHLNDGEHEYFAVDATLWVAHSVQESKAPSSPAAPASPEPATLADLIAQLRELQQRIEFLSPGWVRNDATLHAAQTKLEAAWLVERRVKGVGGTSEWLAHFGRPTGLSWTCDASNALRFQRREDAERIIATFSGGSYLHHEYFASDHLWVARDVQEPKP